MGKQHYFLNFNQSIMKKLKQVPKWVTVMAITLLIPFLAFAAGPADVVTIDVNNAPVTKVLQQIEKQTSYRFSYKEKDVKSVRNVTARFRKTPVTKVLDEIFKGTGMQYKVLSPKLIAITKRSEPAPVKEQVKKSAASRRITGRVEDELGEPLPGALVKCVGAENVSVAADAEGDFTLTVPSGVNKLLVSYIGMQPQTVAAGDDVTVIMKVANSSLDEVVVVGYGVQKKVNVTGAVSMVDEKTFAARPVGNVSQALQGAIPGLNLSTTTAGGQLNATMSMNVRGTGTIGNGSVADPLILIDGIEGNINTLNPNDIESVSVLKDAAASSIYGARAAFGVVLVTTKSGTKGKINVSYSGDMRFSSATSLPNYTNSLEWAAFFNEAQYNENGGYVFDDITLERMRKFRNGEYTDPTQSEYYGVVEGVNGHWSRYQTAFADTRWFDVFYRDNAPQTQHNISLSGGNEKVTWLISGSYLYQEGLMRYRPDTNRRFTTNAKIGAKLTDWARVDYNVKWNRTDYEQPEQMDGLFFHNIARRWPQMPVKDPNGHYTFNTEIQNIVEGGRSKSKGDMFSQQIRFTFNPVKDWNIIVEGANRINHSMNRSWHLPIISWYMDNTPTAPTERSSASQSRSHTNYWSANIFSDYSLSIGKHNGKLLVGMNYEKYSVDGMSGSGYALNSNDKPFISQATEDFRASDSFNHRATAGYFARFNYDYDGRYLFEANVRYDGSSRFVGPKRWAWFPSFSLGWNIARERFFEGLTSYVNTLKPRVSWGKLGNTSSAYSSFWDWYPFFQQQGVGIENSALIIDGKRQNTASLPGIINNALTWEKVSTINVGLDWGMFNNRLTGEFNWFSRDTKDMIGPAPVLSFVLGADAPRANNCDLRTRGWELEVRWNDRIGNVNYGARFNISDTRTKILNYPYNGNFGEQIITSYYNGKNLGEIWGYTTEGIANSDEQMEAWLADNKPNWGSNWRAGDIMYRDLNDDGKVSPGNSTLDDHGDLRVIGNSTPRYRFGINLNAEWKGIDFSVFFQGVMKRDYWFGNEPYFWGASGGMWQSCVFVEHLDYWSPDNQDAYYPLPYFSNTKNKQTQTRYLQDASYIRCKNMQVGYSLPRNLIRRIGMTNCRIYVSVDNLFTCSKMSSVFDPEALSGSNGAGKLYPLTRTWAAGVSLNF